MADWNNDWDNRNNRSQGMGYVRPDTGNTRPGYGIRPPTYQQDLSPRVERLEKIVRDALHENNQWNALLREWQNKFIEIELMSENIVDGKLLWFDRYTLCLEDIDKQKIIVHKGAVAVIRLNTTVPKK